MYELAIMVNERMDSPLFEESNEAIVAVNANFNILIDERTNFGKYLPFNFVLVQNNSSERVRLVVNDSVRKIVPAGTIQTFDASTIPAIWSLRLQNLGVANIAVEELQVSFQKLKGIQARGMKILGWDI